MADHAWRIGPSPESISREYALTRRRPASRFGRHYRNGIRLDARQRPPALTPTLSSSYSRAMRIPLSEASHENMQRRRCQADSRPEPCHALLLKETTID